MLERLREDWVFYQRIAMLMIADALITFLSSFLAISVRQEFIIEADMLKAYNHVLYIDILITILVFMAFNLYKSMWRYASVTELRRLVMGTFVCSIIRFMTFEVFMGVYLPRSWFVIEPIVFLVGTAALRFSYRGLRIALYSSKTPTDDVSLVMIIGAGQAGNVLLREMRLSEKVAKRVVCFIDDDKNKKGMYMNGVPVVGSRDDIVEKAKEYEVDEIYIALPSATLLERRDIIKICSQTNCKLKTLPGIYQMINDEVSVSKLKDVEIEDLLGRDPVEIDMEQVSNNIRGKVVMVTGGGGSIGSELCRQIASYDPQQLVIVDIYENNAYDIQNELKREYPDLHLDVCIASVRDYQKISKIFSKYHPDIVYHAAAHKHVPLMEDAPDEAVKNNVFGTLNVARCADEAQTGHFVLISTDKAVNPTNIMGATKRICEMIVQYYSRHSQTNYAAVRFGNVLGSNGSVVPLFKRQIAEGGPVTVTDKNIIRYFMTIPEAVSLVMQAGMYALGGEIFILDMGEPVRIDDLARNLIRLSGYTPDVDIPVVYTGLRPGEKLYEELLMDEEGITKTANGSIYIGKQLTFDEEDFIKQLENLREHLYDAEHIKGMVSDIVETYTPYY